MSEEFRPDLTQRLLGPRGPEIGCDECFDRLDEYVEAQLAGLDAGRRVPGMAAHLEGCPTCREDYESLSAYLRITSSAH
jgi:hypothetical protein